MSASKWFLSRELGRPGAPVIGREQLIGREQPDNGAVNRAWLLWVSLMLTSSSLLGAGCTVQQDFPRNGCVDGRCPDASVGEGGQDTVVLGDAQAPPMKADGGLMVCPGVCLPDDVTACVGFQPAPVDSESGVNSGSARASSFSWMLAVADAGLMDASSPDRLDGGGFSDASSTDPADASWSEDSSDDGGPNSADVGSDSGRSILEPAPGAEAGLPPPATEAVYACQMAPQGEQLMSGCERAGRGEEGAPCTSPAGCAPGLACVAPGFCRTYCCAGQDSCGESKVCDQRPLHYGAQAPNSALDVPVCVPVESSCSLGQPWVCDEEPCGNCPPDKTCSVLDKRGSRACVDLGPGRDGEQCPCAPGYFCASGSKTCFQYCETTPGGLACSVGHSCQPGPAAFPSGWGLCVRDAVQ